MTIRLPRILIVDDDLGRACGGRNLQRKDFCARLSLRDVTGDVEPEPVDDPVAEGVFVSGQRLESSSVENDLPGTLAQIRNGWGEDRRWALVLLDLHFKTGPLTDTGEPAGRHEDRVPERYFGMELLKEGRRDPALRGLPVVILSSMDRRAIEPMFAALEVFDFADKTAVGANWLREELFHYGLLESEEVIGGSLPHLACLREARRRSRLRDENLLLLGETGVGKDLVARYIHEMSARAGIFVPLFTQGVPETLIEDRLFGHEKSAFQGALSAEPGAAERADGGTLFIDEFGNIPAAIQAKLLRLLDRNLRETQRLGSQQARRLDLLVVMATNRLDILESDDFRGDLLARAKVRNHTILIPALRERREDIPRLAEHFLRRVERQLGVEPREVLPDALEELGAYDWPDNVRELEAVLEDAVSRYRGLRVLAPSHLVLAAEPDGVAAAASTGIGHRAPASLGAGSGAAAAPLDELVALMDAFDPDRSDSTVLLGGLPKIRAEYARLAARLLRAGLRVTSRPTPEKPAGEILIHPALKLLTGNANLTASQAADLVKRTLAIDPAAIANLLEDPILAEAHQTALRLRPKQPPRSRRGSRRES